MYGWGSDDTSTWRGSGGYDYSDAAKGYLSGESKKKKANSRTYQRRQWEPDKSVLPKDRTIVTNSTNPIVIATDVTGSMSDWPYEIFDRLPLIAGTLVGYRPDTEVCFAAIGDATCDAYPLQIADFVQGVDLQDRINALFPEGGGGSKESYELFGYYALKNIEMPNAKGKPFLIMYGDENFYDKIEPQFVKPLIGIDLKIKADSMKMWENLKKKFNAYMIRKPYGNAYHEKQIKEHWEQALGAQKVVPALDKMRIVDQSLAIVAKAWGKYDDFKDNMLARQDAATVDKVLDTVRNA